jgi:structural maintenance of chromosome 3 (chondroitin sulfate proteoglycan 6)
LIRDTDQKIKDEPDSKAQELPETQMNLFSLGNHKYSGMSIKVNLFGGEDLNWSNLSDLSGGEKSIVSLSFLFALNHLTPSMIFLLDEVDSALDRQYREGLTRLLQKLSNEKLQFFITSFKEEFINSVDKTFLVTFKNGKSTLAPCSAEDAETVVAQVKSEE